MQANTKGFLEVQSLFSVPDVKQSNPRIKNQAIYFHAAFLWIDGLTPYINFFSLAYCYCCDQESKNTASTIKLPLFTVGSQRCVLTRVTWV